MRLLLAVCVGGFVGCNNKDKDDTTTDGPQPTDTGPTAFTDRIPQELNSPIDIVWVLDNSWNDGMDAFDDPTLESTFELLLLADPDWRMGILDATATGSQFGMLRDKFETWPIPSTAFQLPNTSGQPRMREALYTALELRRDVSQNQDFVRSDSDLYVIMYSNHEDASDDDTITRADFDTWLAAYEPSNREALGAVTTTETADYWRDRTLGGGTVVTAGSFKKALESIVYAAMGQKSTFTLTHTPTEPPALAWIEYRDHHDEYVLDVDYTYDAAANAITFTEIVPRADSDVVVTYQTEDDVTPDPTGSQSR
ncbi:MAG: hypothetical protein ABMB14_07015 [Myxococcota bacterium]